MQTIEDGFSALIRGRMREVSLDSELLLEDDWTLEIGSPRCVSIAYTSDWCRSPIQLDLVRPILLDHLNGRKTLVDGSDSGKSTLQRELETWFLGELATSDDIEGAVCGTADDWDLTEFKATVAGASHVVLPVGVYSTILHRAIEQDGDVPRAQRTHYSARAGISGGVAYMETSGSARADLLIGPSFTIRRIESGAILADVPRQLRVGYAAPYYKRLCFPWLGEGSSSSQ